MIRTQRRFLNNNSQNNFQRKGAKGVRVETGV